jgi:hypothetical protein
MTGKVGMIKKGYFDAENFLKGKELMKITPFAE